MTAEKLPSGWVLAPLQDIAQVNPRLDKAVYKDDLVVSFVPMTAVEAETGAINVGETREFGAVKKGYTAFREGDVLFAKITPCMENGKMAVVPRLQNGLGFGSTDFHVLRPYDGISADYLYYFVSSSTFRHEAEHNMTGAVGQRRVPTLYLSSSQIPISPSSLQKQIVAKLEELFSELDRGGESLETAREQLTVYRQALLKHAFEGKLTEQWREERKGELVSPEELLSRIRQERRVRYEHDVEEWAIASKEWERNGKSGKRPAKPAKPTALEILPFDDYPALPAGWFWARYGDLCSLIRNGISKKPEGNIGHPIFRISAVRPMAFDLTDIRHIDEDFDDYYLTPGDLVFTRYNGSRAYVGVCAEYKGNGTHLYPDKLVRTTLGADSFVPSYFEKAVSCGASRAFIEGRIRTTAGQSGISGSDIKAIPVPICTPLEQGEIVDRLEGTLAYIARSLDEIETLLLQSTALRQSILKKAFSGQLVHQNPNDEPASILLERIQAQKAEQEAANKAKRKKKAKKKKGKRKDAA